MLEYVICNHFISCESLLKRKYLLFNENEWRSSLFLGEYEIIRYPVILLYLKLYACFPAFAKFGVLAVTEGVTVQGLSWMMMY